MNEIEELRREVTELRIDLRILTQAIREVAQQLHRALAKASGTQP
jgi:hypothetical protein